MTRSPHPARAGVILAAAGWLAACAGGLPRPTPDHAARAAARTPGVTVESLARGRALYVAKCSGCHVLARPETRPPESWAAVVAAMAERSRITGEEADLVSRYLESVRP